MDIHEYQAKELLSGFGVPIQRGAVAYSADQASFVASELGGWHWAVKAQIHSGARGKAGGIKLCKTYQEVRDAAKGMLGKKLVTHQTGPEGKMVQRVYVEVAESFEREIYFGIVLDRKAERVRIIASAQGGMEIEEIAKTAPQAILQVIVEPAVGLQPFQARTIAFGLGLNLKQVSRAVTAILGAYRAFRDLDASMVEINPLVVTKDDSGGQPPQVGNVHIFTATTHSTNGGKTRVKYEFKGDKIIHKNTFWKQVEHKDRL